jgi:hypothetical protein
MVFRSRRSRYPLPPARKQFPFSVFCMRRGACQESASQLGMPMSLRGTLKRRRETSLSWTILFMTSPLR